MTGFADFATHPKMVHLYREAGGYPIVRVAVRPALDDEETVYWGWWSVETENYRHIYPSPHGVEICMPYGSKAEEDRGRGKKLRLIVEEIGPCEE